MVVLEVVDIRGQVGLMIISDAHDPNMGRVRGVGREVFIMGHLSTEIERALRLKDLAGTDLRAKRWSVVGVVEGVVEVLVD